MPSRILVNWPEKRNSGGRIRPPLDPATACAGSGGTIPGRDHRSPYLGAGWVGRSRTGSGVTVLAVRSQNLKLPSTNSMPVRVSVVHGVAQSGLANRVRIPANAMNNNPQTGHWQQTTFRDNRSLTVTSASFANILT